MEVTLLRGSLPDDMNGSGSGSGSGSYWRACLATFAKALPADRQARMAELKVAGATLAYWRSSAAGRPANGGSGQPVKPGDVQTEKGPLSLCSRGTLHATLIPPKWRGERWWIVALIGEVVGDEEKFGALSREIIGECL